MKIKDQMKSINHPFHGNQQMNVSFRFRGYNSHMQTRFWLPGGESKVEYTDVEKVKSQTYYYYYLISSSSITTITTTTIIITTTTTTTTKNNICKVLSGSFLIVLQDSISIFSLKASGSISSSLDLKSTVSNLYECNDCLVFSLLALCFFRRRKLKK